jgi:gas vesicle protein
MDTDNGNEHYENNGGAAIGFLAGLLIGGLAGAITSLLMAPQSGLRTRAQIKRRSVELRDQASEAIEDTLTEARDTGRRLSADVQKQAAKLQQQAEKLQERGQAMIDEQKERWTPVVAAGQKAVNSAN